MSATSAFLPAKRIALASYIISAEIEAERRMQLIDMAKTKQHKFLWWRWPSVDSLIARMQPEESAIAQLHRRVEYERLKNLFALAQAAIEVIPDGTINVSSKDFGYLKSIYPKVPA